MSAETANILDRAADVIERNGWTDCGDFYDQVDDERPITECPVCTIGAIAVAAGRDPENDWHHSPEAVAAAEAVRNYLGLDPGDMLSDGHERLTLAIGDWNDTAPLDDAQVIEVLRGAAQAERERAA